MAHSTALKTLRQIYRFCNCGDAKVLRSCKVYTSRGDSAHLWRPSSPDHSCCRSSQKSKTTIMAITTISRITLLQMLPNRVVTVQTISSFSGHTHSYLPTRCWWRESSSISICSRHIARHNYIPAALRRLRPRSVAQLVRESSTWRLRSYLCSYTCIAA